MPHLPGPDDAALQRAFDSLEDAGVDLTPARRTVLATIHQFGWLDGPDGVGAMLLDAVTAATPASKAATARRVVREHRDAAAAAEARYHAAVAPSWERTSRMDDDGAGYTHLACGAHFGPFVDSVQLTEHRADHDKGCRRG